MLPQDAFKRLELIHKIIAIYHGLINSWLKTPSVKKNENESRCKIISLVIMFFSINYSKLLCARTNKNFFSYV